MKVTCIYPTQGRSVSHELGRMILPQMEEDRQGVEVECMFVRRQGNSIGERLVAVAKKTGMPLMCCYEREIAGKLIEGVSIECLPVPYKPFSNNMPNQVITF